MFLEEGAIHAASELASHYLCSWEQEASAGIFLDHIWEYFCLIHLFLKTAAVNAVF